MGKFIDLTNQKFGRLTVVKRMGTRNKKPLWLCKCDCGNEKLISAISLTSGRTKSCGCLNKELSVSRNSIHNLSHTPLYNIWAGMRSRCSNPSNHAYSRYGGRGIKVCDEWNKSFDKFHLWAISTNFMDTLSLDRIDNNGDYCPENCRWATPQEQARNRRSNNLITINNQTKLLCEWIEYYKLNRSCYLSRIKRGWSVEKALTTPSRKSKSKSRTNSIK